MEGPIHGNRRTDLRARRREGDVPRDFDASTIIVFAAGGLGQRDVDGTSAGAELGVFDAEEGGTGSGAAEEGQLHGDGGRGGTGTGVEGGMGVREVRRAEAVEEGRCVAAVGDFLKSISQYVVCLCSYERRTGPDAPLLPQIRGVRVGRQRSDGDGVLEGLRVCGRHAVCLYGWYNQGKGFTPLIDVYQMPTPD